MLLKLTGGRIIDPAHDVNDVVRDIYIRDGRIVEKPTDGRVDEEIDVSGKVIMAGAIDRSILPVPCYPKTMLKPFMNAPNCYVPAQAMRLQAL